HGQMAEERLEQVMIDFLGGRYDVLVCTTIVEIGLDIPRVNTILIEDAHLLGLAQLYQLRGRVGRADQQAYAYLLYPRRARLTPEAEQRDRKSTRLNSSHLVISYAVFCLKKKKNEDTIQLRHT